MSRPGDTGQGSGDDSSTYGEVRLRRVQGSAGRVFDAMRWLGQAGRAFELMCGRANDRCAHGSLLREKGERQRDVAESVAQIHAARLMTLDTARRMGAGKGAVPWPWAVSRKPGSRSFILRATSWGRLRTVTAQR